MPTSIFRYWPLLSVHAVLAAGLASLALGAAAGLSVPLLRVLGAFAVATSALALAVAVRDRAGRAPSLLAAIVVGIWLGTTVLLWPDPHTLRLVVVGWAMLTGLASVLFALRFEPRYGGALLAVAAFLTLGFGAVLLPRSLHASLPLIVAVYGGALALTLGALALRFRRLARPA